MDFEGFKELASLISRHKTKQIELLGNNSKGEEDSRLNKLYKALAKGVLFSEDEAAKFIFGDKADAKLPEYRKLRYQLITQLSNTVFFMDKNEAKFTDKGKAADNCYRYYFAGRMLMGVGGKTAGVYYLNQVIDIGKKYELVDMVADAAKYLQRHYSTALGDAVKYQKYAELRREYEEKRRWEDEAFEFYHEVKWHYMRGRGTNRDLHDSTAQKLKLLEEIGPKVNTSNFYVYYYNILIGHYLSDNKAQMALNACDEAIQLLLQKENFIRGQVIGFATNKLSCMVQLKQLDLVAGQEAFDFCMQYTDEGQSNWFSTFDIWIHFNLYAGEYQTAFQKFVEATSHRNYKNLSGFLADIWRLYAGYFLLLAEFGKLDRAQVVKYLGGEFKTNRFLNDFEVFTKEKDGMSIPVNLLPVIFSLIENDEKVAGKSMDALDKFRQRHLENNQNTRSAIFVKLIFGLYKRMLFKNKQREKIDETLKSYAEIPLETAPQSYYVEIIPYEDLCNMLLNKIC